MGELVVDPAVLVAAADPLLVVGDRLRGLARSLPHAGGSLGPHELTLALEDVVHAWRPGLHGLGAAAGDTGEQLRAAAVTYDSVERTIRGWSGG